MIKEKGRSAAAANVIELYPLGMQKEIARAAPAKKRKERAKLTLLALSLSRTHKRRQLRGRRDIDRGVAHVAGARKDPSRLGLPGEIFNGKWKSLSVEEKRGVRSQRESERVLVAGELRPKNTSRRGLEKYHLNAPL